MKCKKCKTDITKNEFGFYEDALVITLDGGYNGFVDFIEPAKQFKAVLCHECAHMFMDIHFPDENIKGWHPKVKESANCNGWSIE